jgi:hypothetical protein
MVKPLPITLGKAPSELIRGEPSNAPSMMGNGKAHGMVWKIQGLTNSCSDTLCSLLLQVYLQQKVVMPTACDAVACNHNLHKIRKNCGGQETLIDYL